jgi:hypothetical protein
MDLEETEARNDCAGKDQQQSNWKTDFLAVEKVKSHLKLSSWLRCETVASQQSQKPLNMEAEESVLYCGICYQAVHNEDIGDLVRAIVNCKTRKLVKRL